MGEVQPQPRDLVSLDAVRRFLGLKDGATANDDLLQELISDVSARAIDDTGREFVSADAEWTDPDAPAFGAITVPARARLFIADGGGRLRVGAYHELVSATSTYYGAAGATAVDVTGWQLLPYAGPPYFEIGYSIGGAVRYNAGVQLAVTAKWGYLEIPRPVQRAVIQQVALEYQRDVAQFSETFNLSEDRVDRPRGWGSAPWDVLDGYRDLGPILA